MVEGEGRVRCEECVDRAPQCSGGVAACACGGEGGGEEQVGDGQDGSSRVASVWAVGAQLLEVARGRDPGFLFELASGRLVCLFVLTQEAAGQGQVVLEGLDTAAHDERVQGVVDDRQSHDIDGDRDGEGFSHSVSITYLCRVDIKC